MKNPQIDEQKPSIKYDDLENALSFVNDRDVIDCAAYITRKTGKIYWESSEFNDEFEVPDYVNDSALYAEVPDGRELDLGVRLVMRFTEQVIPEHYDRVSNIFHRRGAYSRFKEFLDGEGVLEDWYRFEESATEEALREWAEQEGFTVKPTEDR